MTLDAYTKKWNSFSWEIDLALGAFHSMLGVRTWQDDLMGRLHNKTPVALSPHVLAVMTFSNAVLTQFFITACRIRETTNTKLSLPALFDDAVGTFVIDAALIGSMQALIDNTKPTFEKLKKARGMSVAHLHDRENPFAVLKREKVTTEIIRSYLGDCLSLYAMLGKPIGRDFPTDPARHQAASADVAAAFYKLFPL